RGGGGEVGGEDAAGHGAARGMGEVGVLFAVLFFKLDVSSPVPKEVCDDSARADLLDEGGHVVAHERFDEGLELLLVLFDGGGVGAEEAAFLREAGDVGVDVGGDGCGFRAWWERLPRRG